MCKLTVWNFTHEIRKSMDQIQWMCLGHRALDSLTIWLCWRRRQRCVCMCASRVCVYCYLCSFNEWSPFSCAENQNAEQTFSRSKACVVEQCFEFETCDWVSIDLCLRICVWPQRNSWCLCIQGIFSQWKLQPPSECICVTSALTSTLIQHLGSSWVQAVCLLWKVFIRTSPDQTCSAQV